jgi:hypothetical protein
MDWSAVAEYLEVESLGLQERAEFGFPNDPQTQREMRTRAAIFVTFAKAIRAGIDAVDRSGS